MKDSLIDRLLKEAVPLKRVERADVLYKCQELEEAHMASAVKGDSLAPSAEEPVGFHFITFTKGNDGHLWEVGIVRVFSLASDHVTDITAARGKLGPNRSWSARRFGGYAE